MSRFGKPILITESVKAERDVIIKLLRAYKDNAVLWNTCHPDYNNKARKNKAQEKLVKIYKEIEPNAEMAEVKKKLDNMRSSGKRYFKRKLEAKSKGKRCTISLWYYDEIKFLYGDTNDENTDNDDAPILLDEEESESTKPKPNEYNEFLDDNNYETYLSTSFIDHSLASPSGLSNHSKEKKRKFSISEEANLFGTAIDHQLSEVTPEQKEIAEKLISRIVCLAKINKLTHQTDISIKSFDEK